jgi:type I restriction enzyme S subunit
MNAQRLLQHFDRISGAPDAIPRLRRFVLDLAVRGKLVEQDPNDEPASELLNRIRAEKVRLIATGAAKDGRPTPPLGDDEPFRIPKNWSWSQVAEIGFINPRNTAQDGLLASFVPMTLIPVDYGASSTWEVRPWGAIKSGFTHFADGDVALAKITPCFQNGKSTVFRGLSNAIGAGTTELHVVRPVVVDPDYLLVFFKCSFFIESGVPRMTGTAGQKRVPMDYFAYSPFPLPPLAEQHRIITKVDELMALCDRLEVVQAERETRRDRLVAGTHARLIDVSASDSQLSTFFINHLRHLTTRIEHIKQLRQTILNLAVCGRLLSGDSFSDQIEKKVGNFVKFLNGYAFQSTLFRTTGVRLCRNVNVGHGSLNWQSDNTACVAEESALDFQRFNLKEGDIVLSLDRPLISTGLKVAQVRQNDLPCLLLQRVGKAEFLSDGLAPDFFLLWLQSSQFTAAIDPGRSKGVPHISTRQVEALPLFVPSLPEQKRIVAKVNELMALCDRLEEQLNTEQTENRRFLEALLHRALAPVGETVELETAA